MGKQAKLGASSRKSHGRNRPPPAGTIRLSLERETALGKVEAAVWVVLGWLGQCVVQDAYQHVKALVCAWLG